MHQAVVSQITAVKQRRNNNKSYREKIFDSTTNNNTNWSKRAHWLQTHCHSADCSGGLCRFHKANTAVISTRARTERQRKRDNCNRHWQELELSQLSDRGWDRATQLVAVEESVDVTTYKLQSSAHEYEQIHSANESIVIVTHKIWSAVNCPIENGIVPFSWLLLTCLLISQSTHCCHQHTNTNR